MPNLDPARRTIETTEVNGVPTEITHAFLQSTYRKPTPPERREINPRTEKRLATGAGEEGHYRCRDFVTPELVDQPWGNFWIIVYEAVQKEKSGWYYFGIGLAIIGTIALCAVGVGWFVGAGWAVTASGGATLTAGVISTGGTLTLSQGIRLISGEPAGYTTGAVKYQGAADRPTGPELHVIGQEELKRDWHDCN